mmetsp:Transcript_71521/g.202017  ORF Transcript_71521/g.202017 Transcript_71521/m.202017 type:complete len:220 (+) Transcript_71521:6711-7370(+)
MTGPPTVIIYSSRKLALLMALSWIFSTPSRCKSCFIVIVFVTQMRIVRARFSMTTATSSEALVSWPMMFSSMLFSDVCRCCCLCALKCEYVLSRFSSKNTSRILASPFLQPFGGSVHHAQASSWASVPLVPLVPLVPPAPRRWSFRVVCAPTRRVGLYGKWSFDRIRLRRWSAACCATLYWANCRLTSLSFSEIPRLMPPSKPKPPFPPPFPRLLDGVI